MNQIGAQLYTVRSLLNTDEEALKPLQKIKQLGYSSVQLYGGEEQIRRCARAARAVGLPISGILATLDLYVRLGETLFDLCREYQIPEIGISASYTEYEEAVDFIGRVNCFAKIAHNHGLRFSYHNHAKEFIRTSCGKTIMELYLEGFDPVTVEFMPDTYWIQYGGFDVRRFLELTQGRVHTLHLKDMKFTKDGPKFAEIGRGNLYFRGIVETALACGIHSFVVEQDTCDNDPLLSLQESYSGIRDLNILTGA